MGEQISEKLDLVSEKPNLEKLFHGADKGMLAWLYELIFGH